MHASTKTVSGESSVAVTVAIDQAKGVFELAFAETHPPYEKLVGDLAGAFSRRINIQYRLVYQVLHAECVVKVLRMWTC